MRDYDPFNPYRHGSEAEADDLPGGFVRFSGALGLVVKTAACAMHLRAENDAKKTELCLELGIPLLRFTGREIYRNQRFCAEQCLICLDRGEAFDA